MPLLKIPATRSCQVCSDSFTTRVIAQLKCDICMVRPKPVGPDCACGCGEKTNWQNGKGWSDYRQGHLIRKVRPPHAKELDPNWRPWNYGMDSRVTCVCETCGIQFKEHYKAKFCSLKCRDAPRRRERRLSKSGKEETYWFVRNDKDKWVQEHRYVMEKHLGRKLLKTEIVHHRNHEKLCNDISNLFVMHCSACHTSHHQKNRPLEYIYHDVHSEAARAAKAKRKAKKYCRVCTVEFKPTAGNQNRCRDCMENEEKHAPFCACGCGEKTTYRSDGGYGKFIRGHHARVKNPNDKGMCQHKSVVELGRGAWCENCGSAKLKGKDWQKPGKLKAAVDGYNRRGKRLRVNGELKTASPNSNPIR